MSAWDDAVSSEEPIGRHLLPLTAEIADDGRLSVGGIDAVALAEEYGTPLFVYDEAHLRARCTEARLAFPGGAAYATKAFFCGAMARLALEEGLSLDVSTDGELEVALHAGAPGERLIFHGNNKSKEELRRALSLPVHRLVVDSLDEIARIAELGTARAVPQRVFIRVNPGVDPHTHEFVTTGQEDSKFGFSLALGTADEAVRALRALSFVELAGVHAHVGSQVFELDAYDRVIEVVASFAARHGLSEICIGGGLGVAYLNGESAPSITDWAAGVHASLSKFTGGSEFELSSEPGRSIVATAGLTCYSVGTIKHVPGVRSYLSVDGGMSDNPRPVLYGSGYEAFLARAAAAERPFAARIVGKHCESGDVVVADARLPADVAVGDVLVTPVTGAYGYAMASNYNRVPRPAVVFVEDGRARVVQRRETLDDLLRLEP